MGDNGCTDAPTTDCPTNVEADENLAALDFRSVTLIRWVDGGRPTSRRELLMKSKGPLESDEEQPTSRLVRLAFSCFVGSLLFVPLWAGMNFAFGTALDGPIGAFVMEPPCQRLAGTTEPLSRYTLGNGKARFSSSVYQFASGPIRVADGRTDGLGFTGHELAYLALGFVGYAVCFAGALVLTVSIVRVGRRFFALAWGRASRSIGRRG